MDDDTKVAEASPPTNPPALTSAQRMRVYRTRRRRGLHCVTTVLREGQIERLIQRGGLNRAKRADRAAICEALSGYLSDNLGDAYR
jgi:hypothetical protein